MAVSSMVSARFRISTTFGSPCMVVRLLSRGTAAATGSKPWPYPIHFAETANGSRHGLAPRRQLQLTSGAPRRTSLVFAGEKDVESGNGGRPVVGAPFHLGGFAQQSE